jgi:hypothetical protein
MATAPAARTASMRAKSATSPLTSGCSSLPLRPRSLARRKIVGLPALM